MDMTREHFISTFRLSQNTSIPLYAQLAEYLRHQIKSGALNPGDRLIGENDMVELLGFSRSTVRAAINRLVAEGYITRYRGKGSFVAEPKLKRNINYLYNFTENIKSLGSVPSSQVMRCEVIGADGMLAEKMKLATLGQKVFVLERLRMADGQPVIWEKTCIPYYLCDGIETVDFTCASLYQQLESRYGLQIDRADETIEAVILNKAAQQALGCRRSMAGYSIQRLSYLNSGYICEFTQSVTRGDRCVFRLDLHNIKSDNSGGSIDFQRELNVSSSPSR